MNLDKMPTGSRPRIMIVEFMKSFCSFLCLQRDVVHNLFFFYSFSDSCRFLLHHSATKLQVSPIMVCSSFFLILKHFSFQKKKGFVGHLGPLPGFFQTQVWPQ